MEVIQHQVDIGDTVAHFVHFEELVRAQIALQCILPSVLVLQHHLLDLSKLLLAPRELWWEVKIGIVIGAQGLYHVGDPGERVTTVNQSSGFVFLTFMGAVVTAAAAVVAGGAVAGVIVVVLLHFRCVCVFVFWFVFDRESESGGVEERRLTPHDTITAARLFYSLLIPCIVHCSQDFFYGLRNKTTQRHATATSSPQNPPAGQHGRNQDNIVRELLSSSGDICVHCFHLINFSQCITA